MADRDEMLKQRFNKLLIIYSFFVCFIPLLLETLIGTLPGSDGPYVDGSDVGICLAPLAGIALSFKGPFGPKLKYILLPAVPLFIAWIGGVSLTYKIFGYTINWLFICAGSFGALLFAMMFIAIIAWYCSYRDSKKVLD